MTNKSDTAIKDAAKRLFGASRTKHFIKSLRAPRRSYVRKINGKHVVSYEL